MPIRPAPAGSLLALFACALLAACGGEGGGEQAPPASPAGIASEEDVLAILKSAQRYRGLEEWGKADAVLAAAVRKYPQDRAIRLAYGDLLVQMNEKERAYEQFREGLALGGEPSPEHAKDLATAGTLASALGRHDEAIGWFEQAERLDPADVRVLAGLANAWLGKNETAKAKATLLRAVAIDEASALAWGMLAEIELRENRAAKAAEFAARARGLEPERIAWRIIEGRARMREGEPERAIELLAGLPQSEATREEVVRLKAESFAQLGRIDAAYGAYADALGAHRTNAAFVFQAALWAERAGRNAEALRHANLAAMLGHAGGADLAARLKAAEGERSAAAEPVGG